MPPLVRSLRSREGYCWKLEDSAGIEPATQPEWTAFSQLNYIIQMSLEPDLNRQPSAYKAGALPVVLPRQYSAYPLVTSGRYSASSFGVTYP